MASNDSKPSSLPVDPIYAARWRSRARGAASRRKSSQLSFGSASNSTSDDAFTGREYQPGGTQHVSDGDLSTVNEDDQESVDGGEEDNSEVAASVDEREEASSRSVGTSVVDSEEEEGRCGTCIDWLQSAFEDAVDKLPEGTEPVLRSSLVPFVIFCGAFLVSAIGITGSILSVDTTVGNMMNITAQLGTQEVRYSAAEYAIKGQLSSRIFSDLEHSTGQLGSLERYLSDDQDLREIAEKQWNGFRAFLGKQVAEDDKLLWLEVWDLHTGHMYGASSVLNSDDGMPKLYDYLPSCSRQCQQDDWTSCCETLQGNFSRKIYGWKKSVHMEDSTGSEWGDYTLEREIVRRGRLGAIECSSTDCSEDFMSPKSLWEATTYMADITTSGLHSTETFRVPNKQGLQPYWRIINAQHAKKLPMVEDLGGTNQVAILTTPLISSNGSQSRVKIATVAIDTSVFTAKVMAAIAVSGVGDPQVNDFTHSGYPLSNGGCFGLVDLSSNSPVGGDKDSQDTIEADSWKHTSMFPPNSDSGPSPFYHPVDLCRGDKLSHFSKISQEKVRKYSKESAGAAEIVATKFRRVLPGSLSFWPLSVDKNPLGESTAAYYRNPFASDSSAGDAVSAFHVSSLHGWPVDNLPMSTPDLMKLSAEAANPPNPLGGYSDNLELFLPNWGLYVGAPRTKVISYLQKQMIGSITLTLLVVVASAMVLLRLAAGAIPPEVPIHNRVLQWFRSCSGKSKAQNQNAKQQDNKEGKSMVLGGLEPHALLVSLLAFALTMFLTFVSSSTWGRATDDVSFRVTECGSTVASREIEQNAGFRRLAISLAADVRDIHFIVPSSLIDVNSESSDAFSQRVQAKLTEYHQSAFSSAQKDKSEFLEMISSVPDVVVQSEFMKSAASLSFIEVMSTFGHTGLGIESLGSTVWNGAEQGGYIAVQPLSLSTENLKEREKTGLNPCLEVFSNTTSIVDAWDQSAIGSISLLVRAEVDPNQRENRVTEYSLYPRVVNVPVDYSSDSSSFQSADVDLVVSWHKSIVDLAADLVVVGIMYPASLAAVDEVETPPSSQKHIECLAQHTMTRTQIVGSTNSPVELSSYPWFSAFNHYSDSAEDAISERGCPLIGVPTLSATTSSGFQRSLFSATWTYVYSVWFPQQKHIGDLPEAIILDNREKRTFTFGSRAVSLSSGEAHATATNGTLLFEAFGQFMSAHWEQAPTVKTRPDSMESNGGSRMPEYMDASPRFPLFAVYHADLGLGGLNTLLGRVPVRFSTRSPFDNTSPFEIGVNSYEQPHRLVASEGPLRAMHSLDARQVSLPRYLGFSTAHDPALVDGFPFGNVPEDLQRETIQIQEAICSSEHCVTNFPERQTSHSPLFSSAGQEANKFEAIVRPASILLGASHGGVLQQDSNNGAFERMFLRDSDDVYVRTAALEIANDVDFFQYADDATSVLQNIVQLSGLSSPETKRTALFGTGVHAEYIHSRHVVGGASGAAIILRRCLNDSSTSPGNKGTMDAFVSAMLANSLRIGNDLDVISSGLIHRQTIKRESISWQLALFLIALGPLLAATLFAGILTTKLRRYYKGLMKPLSPPSGNSLVPPPRRGTAISKSSSSSFVDNKSERKMKRASLLWRTSLRVMGQTEASSESQPASVPPPTTFSTDNTSEPLIPPDPAIEAAMRAVHQHVSAVYARNSLWDAWQYHDIKEMARMKFEGPRNCKEKIWQRVSRLWAPSLDSEHVRNPLAGLPEEVQKAVLNGDTSTPRRGATRTHMNPIAHPKKSLLSSNKTIHSTADICWENSIFRRAREFIHMYSSDRHPLEVVILDREGRFTAENFHRLLYTTIYVSIVYLVIAALLLLAFFEASSTVVEGGTLDDASVIVGLPSSAADHARIFPMDATNSSSQDIEVDIGVGLEGAEQLPVEHSVDGRGGWTAANEAAWGSSSASRPAEQVSKLRSQLLLAEFFILFLLGLDNVLFYYAKGIRKKFKSLYNKQAARSSISSQKKNQEDHNPRESPENKNSARSSRSDAGRESKHSSGTNSRSETKTAARSSTNGFAQATTFGQNPLNVLSRSIETDNVSERLSVLNKRSKKSSTLHKLFVVRCILLTGLILDFLVRLGIDYRTGRSATILPLTVFLRPLYAILRIPSLRRSIQALGSTILMARRTFTLFIVFTIVIASLSIALFSDFTDLGDDPVGGEPPNPITFFPFSSEDEVTMLEDNTKFHLFQAQSETVSVMGYNPRLASYETEEFALPSHGRGFTNFQSSWYTLFILSATGENYDDITYPQRDPNDEDSFLGGLYRPYMVLLALLGMFIMSALLLVSFQSRFSESYDHRARRVTRRRRFAPLVAFSLLDMDGNGSIDRYEYEGFFKACKIKRAHYADLNDKLSATEFVYLCEHLAIDFGFDFEKGAYKTDVFLSSASSLSLSFSSANIHVAACLSEFREFLYRFYHNEMALRYDDVALVIVLVHTWTIMLLGTRLTSYADPVMGALSFLQALEVFFHVAASGVAEFWFGKHRKKYKNVGKAMTSRKSQRKLNQRTLKDDLDEEEEEQDVDARSNYQLSANRFDLIVVVLSLLTVFATSFIGVEQGSTQIVKDERYTFAVNVGMRIAVTLPVLRLFSVIHSTRRLVFGLLKQGKKFVNITVLIFLTMFTFSIFGVWLFGGQYRRLSEDTYGMVDVNFDTFSQSMLTLFLIMEGEQWHRISYAAADARHSLVPLAYFILFVIVNGLLFTNLFIGVLCDTFASVEKKELDKARRQHERELDEELFDGEDEEGTE